MFDKDAIIEENRPMRIAAVTTPATVADLTSKVTLPYLDQ